MRFDGEYADIAAVDRISAVLSPRGPDGCGVWCRGPVAFGHRRLSIIDLSVDGSQPMVDPELGLSLIFNGCIYNYQQLRAELEGHGHRFFSTSDTEVIGKAYAEWGLGCVDHFFGMFAFAIFEQHTGRLILGRDRLGIKPLYLDQTAQRLRFASTLPALLAGGGTDTSIDQTAAGLLHDLPQRRTSPLFHRVGHPEIAARHATGGGSGRFARRSPVLGSGL